MYLFSGASFLNSAPAKVDKGAEVDPCLLRHPSPTTKADLDNAEVDEDNKDIYFGAGGCRGR